MLLAAALSCTFLYNYAEQEPDKCQNCVLQQQQQQYQQQLDAQTDQVVISNFANMLMSIIQMAANPYDPQTLAQNGCNIVAGIANIAQQACKMVKEGEVAEDQIAEHLYAKMIELGIHEQIAQQVSRSSLRSVAVPIPTLTL